MIAPRFDITIAEKQPKLDYNPHRNAKGHLLLHVLLHDPVVTFGVCISLSFHSAHRAGQRGVCF